LIATGEPAEPMRTLAEPEVTSNLLQSAWRKFEPFNRQFLDTADDDSTNQLEAMQWTARFDPQAGRKLADSANDLKYGWFRDFTRQAAFDALLPKDLEGALDMIPSFEDTHNRAHSYLEAAKSLPNEQRERKLQLLGKALEVTRTIEGDWLLINLANISNAYRAIGDEATSRALLNEALKRSATLPKSERSEFDRAFLAEHLVLVDREAAIKLLGQIEFESDFSHDRHYGNVAHTLADSDPAAAEHFRAMMKTQNTRDTWTPRICYSMAAVDFERARRLADSVADPDLRAYSLGVMAPVVASKNRKLAEHLIREAYEIITELVETNTSPGRSIVDPLDVAVGLLPFVEMTDPTLVCEYFWRALSLRDNTTIGSETRLLGYHGKFDRLRLADPVLATALARYDRHVAKLVMHPPADQAIASGEDYPSHYFYAYSLLDPKAAIELAARLPEDGNLKRRAKWKAWQEVLSSLRNRGEERWKRFYDTQLSVWYLGQRDI
jgi:hypothetical protein